MSNTEIVPYKHISVIIMPTDYCNMKCIYCFNSRKTNCEKKVMTLKTLEHIFSIIIPFYDEIRFIWHGGEPTSVGIDFFKQAIDLQKKINTKKTKIENSIQSNLTLLDDEFVEFLLNNNFHIGGSFDGMLNELTRHNSDKILAGRQKVIDAGGKVGFICVVQNKNINNLINDYEWFKENNINYTLNMYMTSQPANDPLFVSPSVFSKKICELFDYWLKDAKCNIHISYFEEFLEYIFFGKKNLCCYNSCLGKNIGIQYNGDIYNCNRDFDKDYCYGNVTQYKNIRECFDSAGFKKSVDSAYRRREYCKNNCDIFDFCSGGCNSVAYMGGKMEMPNENVCDGLRQIYHYIDDVSKRFLSGENVDKVCNPVFKDIINKLKKM